ncbi:MAG TPA: VIT domain-containing protein [Planctomycetota bacterium]|nr:VIT domain-containing protein [Planctomycetota bacterium]
MRHSGRSCCAVVLLFAAFAASQTEAATARDGRRFRTNMVLNDNSVPPLALKSHIVNVDIRGRVAKVVSESVYHNSSARELEATYVFPLPKGATVEKFIMWMNGEPVEAKVGEKEAARRTYESIVHRKKDPGLIEQIAEGVFRMRVYPVMPGADQKVRLEYSYVLPISEKGTVVTFDYPLDVPPAEKTDAVAKNFVVTVGLEMEAPIASIESSTHKISYRINEENPRKARASIEEADATLDRDFALKITLKERTSPVSTLTYRPAAKDGAAEEGTLMLLITPEVIAGDEVQAKDVVMVMDTSGSMGGEKIVQARAALVTCLDRLRTADRFAIVTFSDDVNTFRKDWCEATPENIAAAKTFVASLRDAGSTNIEAAIESALAYKHQAGRLRQVLFATDGCPTAGLTDIDKLVEVAVDKSADGKAETRFFTFGIGYDVNTRLLDSIAALTRSERTYVRPEENIERKLADLCDRIAAPVLTDVSINFSENLDIKSTYPQKVGDLYLGRQAVVVGRYKTAGKGSVTIKGKRAGKDFAIEAPLDLPEQTAQATSYLPKQWAMRKVGYLLDQMRLHGENAEIKEEVIRLGTTYSIVTPYTSYLALEKADQHRYQEAGVRADKLAGRSDVVVPPDILAKAQLGDHSETINPDRPDTHSAFGNPQTSEDDLIGVGGKDAAGGGGWGGGSGGGDGTGIAYGVGAGRGSFGTRNGGGRKLMVKRHGGSKATESAVDAALAWLAMHQEADGHWNAAKWGGAADGDLATTSLSLLAMLGAGHTEKVGQYKDNVKRAIAWLKAQQPESAEGKTLNDAQLIAIVAFCEAAGMSNVSDTKATAQHLIDDLVKKAGDLSNAVMMEMEGAGKHFSIGWYVMALKSAKVAGLKVPHEAFEAVIKFIDGCERKDGTVSRYTQRPDEAATATDTTATAAALLARHFLGWKAEELQATAEALVKEGGLPKDPIANARYVYFANLAVFQQGGELWKTWNDAMRNVFTSTQHKAGDDAGSWKFEDKSNASLGRAGHTALGALCMEVYYRYVKLTADPAPIAPDQAPAPAVVPNPAPNFKQSDTGKAGVDYSEYIKKLQEGVEPTE